MKKQWKKYGVLFLTIALLLTLAACGGKSGAKSDEQQNAAVSDENTDTSGENADISGENAGETSGNSDDSAENPAEPEDSADLMGFNDDTTMRVAALKGPTAMGLVKLMSDMQNGDDIYGTCDFTLAASPDEVSPLLIRGELDAACIPANLAAVLYQRTEGQIVTLAVNTLGVLYIVENGNAVQSMTDLAGKTIVASGKGSTPEYALRYLLEQNGVNPETDVVIDWRSEHSECVAALASGAATVAMLPQPFVTVARSTVPDLRVALDLTEEWDNLNNGSGLVTGVVAARREFVEEHPEVILRFLAGYAGSVEWVNENIPQAAELIGSYDIVAAPVAEQALPYCNIVCLTGSEMKEKLSGYLEVLYNAAPESTGGVLPDDAFYYGA